MSLYIYLLLSLGASIYTCTLLDLTEDAWPMVLLATVQLFMGAVYNYVNKDDRIYVHVFTYRTVPQAFFNKTNNDNIIIFSFNIQSDTQ